VIKDTSIGTQEIPFVTNPVLASPYIRGAHVYGNRYLQRKRKDGSHATRPPCVFEVSLPDITTFLVIDYVWKERGDIRQGCMNLFDLVL
jgi:hypothetical protein